MGEIKRCTWTRVFDDDDDWESDCAEMFTLVDGTPLDNGMAYCCYCGRPLVEDGRKD